MGGKVGLLGGDSWLVRLESKSFGWIGWGELGSWIVVGAGDG